MSATNLFVPAGSVEAISKCTTGDGIIGSFRRRVVCCALGAANPMAETPRFSVSTLLQSNKALLDSFESHEGSVAAAMTRAVMAEVASYPASGEPGMSAEVHEHSLEHV